MMEGGHRGDRNAGREMGREGKGNERWDRAPQGPTTPHGTANVIFRVLLRPFLHSMKGHYVILVKEI
jgi:hypothetical protein